MELSWLAFVKDTFPQDAAGLVVPTFLKRRYSSRRQYLCGYGETITDHNKKIQ